MSMARQVDVACGKTTARQTITHDVLDSTRKTTDNPKTRHSGQEVISQTTLSCCWAIIVVASISIVLRLRSCYSKVTAWYEEVQHHEVPPAPPLPRTPTRPILGLWSLLIN